MNDREDVIILFVLTVINGKKLSILTAFTKLRKSNAKIEIAKKNDITDTRVTVYIFFDAVYAVIRIIIA